MSLTVAPFHLLLYYRKGSLAEAFERIKSMRLSYFISVDQYSVLLYSKQASKRTPLKRHEETEELNEMKDE